MTWQWVAFTFIIAVFLMFVVLAVLTYKSNSAKNAKSAITEFQKQLKGM